MDCWQISWLSEKRYSIEDVCMVLCANCNSHEDDRLQPRPSMIHLVKRINMRLSFSVLKKCSDNDNVWHSHPHTTEAVVFEL